MVATGRGTALYSGGRGASGGDPGASVKRWAAADHKLRNADAKLGNLERSRQDLAAKVKSARKAEKDLIDASGGNTKEAIARNRADTERATERRKLVEAQLAETNQEIDRTRREREQARVERDWNGDRLDTADKKAAAALSLKMDGDPTTKRRREREERAEQRLKDAEARADQRRERKGEAWNRHREERQERLREKRRGREERQEAARMALKLSPSDFAKWTAARQTVRFLEGAIREQQAILDDPKATSEEKAAARTEIKELEAQQAIARADQQWIDEGGFPLHELDCCDPAYARCRPPCLPEQRCDCVRPEHCGPSKKTPGEKGKGGGGGVPPGLREETVTAAGDSAAPAEEPERPEDSKPGVAPPRRGGAGGRDGGAASPVSPEATPGTQTIEPPKPPDVPDDEVKTRLGGTAGAFVERSDPGGKRKYYVPTGSDRLKDQGKIGIGLPREGPCVEKAPAMLLLWERRRGGRFALLRDKGAIRRILKELCDQLMNGTPPADAYARLDGLEVELLDTGVEDDATWLAELFESVVDEMGKWGDAAAEIVKENVEAVIDLVKLSALALTDPALVWEELKAAIADFPQNFAEQFRDFAGQLADGDRKAILELATLIVGAGAARGAVKRLLSRVLEKVRAARAAVARGGRAAAEKIRRIMDRADRGDTVGGPAPTRKKPEKSDRDSTPDPTPRQPDGSPPPDRGGGGPEDEPPFDPKGTVGAARLWTVARRLEHAGLPAEGPYAFRPGKRYHPSQPLRRGDRGWFLDEYGNEWVKSWKLGSTGGEWHWDVIFGRRPPAHFRAVSKSGLHINVTPDGRIDH